MRNKKRQRKMYSETFKARAVRLAKSSTRPVSQVARELQISEKTLHTWVRVAALSHRIEPESTESSEAAAATKIANLESELARLKQRCAQLRMAAVCLADGEN